ncbi:surfeit locus protein 5 subunit 22 of mediator complex-domain-containing protein [Limtongia smithiae]|uniref:surfeit locus protein 5 subunit 22 of mediator complex-domain-containing protein n=1 Tax=Limtongia smithiae TaxID=1125753 RepID=UPI0034CDF8BF
MSTQAPAKSQQFQQRAQNINQRINEATGTIIQEFTELIALAPVNGKDLTATAVDVYQIECRSTSIVRAVEDLLLISRSLKEAWILDPAVSS